MPFNSKAAQTASNRNLMRLFWLRNIMVLCLVLGAFALNYVSIPLPRTPIGIAVVGAMLLNILTWLRLQRHETVSEREMFAQLTGDLAALTVLFYFSGGYSNPFIWIYLLPVVVAAITLQRRHAWALTIIAVACYTVLMFFYVPLSHLHMHTHLGSDFNIHLVGMWMGFIVSATIVAGFVSRIGNSLREYDRLMAEAREKALESERILALGTLATAAAHELGTPLSTMAVVAGEMAKDCEKIPELEEPLILLQSQILRCKEILNSITATAGQARAEAGSGQSLDTFLQQVFMRWQDTRPATQLELDLRSPMPSPEIAVDRTLGQALMNLLDNAADASPARIQVSGGWNGQGANAELNLNIRDFGSGIPPEIAHRAGTPFFTTKEEHGLGLGLYLAKLILERFGGTVQLLSHAQGGTVTNIRLPLRMLLV